MVADSRAFHSPLAAASQSAVAATAPTSGGLSAQPEAARAAAGTKRILLVDDDRDLTEMIREYLEPEGFSVEIAHGSEPCFAANLEQNDLILLDVMLPGISGLDVLKHLRQRSSIPVILLTARDGDTERVVGLELGADDFVPKPFNPRELVARIRAVLRRAPGSAGRPGLHLSVGDVQLDAAARSARCGARALDLTTAEFNLLEHLLRNAGEIVTRDELSAAAFGRQQTSRIDRNVDTLVSKVRRKLDPEGDIERRIKTVRNIGYLYARPMA